MNRHVYKSGIEYKVKKRGKVLAVSLILSMIIGLLGGCGMAVRRHRPMIRKRRALQRILRQPRTAHRRMQMV